MTGFLTLLRRELRAYLCSPGAYIVAALFLLVAGAGFWTAVASIAAEPDGAVGLIEVSTWMFLLTIAAAAPLLSMRLFAEEYRTGTYETLMTAPVRPAAVVLAKYAGALLWYLAMLLPTLAWGPMLATAAAVPPAPDPAAVAGAYLGALLIGAWCLALGLFASALMRSQVAAGVLAVALILGWLFAGWVPFLWPIPAGDRLGAWISPVVHIADWSRGILDTRPLVAYLVNIAWVLFATDRVLEWRRWR
ncbi:MAG: ABC transporter permease [Kiritimatiellae bacterium]|nr:ABC transporter permease [Kiritimatiellia bacterium]